MAMLYERCPACEAFEGRTRGATPEVPCRGCGGRGFIETGITRGQVDRLVAAATRLDLQPGDIVRTSPAPPEPGLLFVVQDLAPDDLVRGRLLGAAATGNTPNILSPAIQCTRVGRLDRRLGQPC